MPKPCSLDLRMRLLEAVIAGASRRDAADCFDVSASSAVKWLQLWQETGSVAAKPTGGSISPLEEHADWLELERFLKPFLAQLGHKARAADVPDLCIGTDRSWRSQEHSADGGAACSWRLRSIAPLHRGRDLGRQTCGDRTAGSSG